MSKTLRTLMAAMLVLATGLALSVPTASAHFCQSASPTGCGDCDNTGRPHIHNWTVAGRRILEWCSSNILDPGLVGSVGLDLERTDVLLP